MSAILRWAAAVFLAPLAIQHLDESMSKLHDKVDAIADRLKDVENEVYLKWRE